MMFWRIVRSTRRPQATASASFRKSSPSSTRSADSMVTSLPISARATPTSAATSEGASLMPSPTIATGARVLRKRAIHSAFSAGKRPK